MTPANDNTRHKRVLNGDGSNLYAKQPFLTEDERTGVRVEKSRLAKRAAIGSDWDGKPDNDNLNWPLATSLIREGNVELLKTAMAYRRIHDQANSGAVLGGSTYTAKEGKVIDYVSRLDESTGVVQYGKARKSRSVDAIASTPARKKNVTNETTISASSPVPKPWSGDRAVNDMIDAKPKLAAIRHRLGVLVEPLEMSVVDGATYEKVGYSLGESHKRLAQSTGCAVVHLALISVRDSLGAINREDLAA